MNFGNPYSAAQALNIGIDKARSNIVVLCHQDVLFYENWVEMLFERITEIEQLPDKKITEMPDNPITKRKEPDTEHFELD